MKEIPLEEVAFHPRSRIDPNGRLFYWRGGLYRGLSQERSDFYRGLFERNVVGRLVDRGLIIDTDLQPYSMAGFGMVVRHREIDLRGLPV